MTDIRLVMPKYSMFQNPVQPLGLYYVKAFLEKHGYRVTVTDTNVRKLTFGNEPVVGVSVPTFLFKEASEIIMEAKKLGKTVICGGAHAWSDPDSLLELGADYVVQGDGEKAALKILDGLAAEDPLKEKILNFPVNDLDNLPIPEHVCYPSTSVHVLSTSRGCVYNCSFCSVGHIGKYRVHNPARVVEEMRRMDGGNISIIDDLFTLNTKRLHEIQRLMQKEKIGVSIVLGNGTRVDMMGRERLTVLRRMNCTSISYGVESVDSQVLKACNKHITPLQAEKTIELTKQFGINTSAFMIIGLPYDTYEKTMRSAAWIRKRGVPAFWNIAVPYPRTQLHEWVSKHGAWLIDPKDYSNYGGHFGKAGKILWDTPNYPISDRLKAYNLLSKNNYPMWKQLAAFFLLKLGKNKRTILRELRDKTPGPLRRFILGITDLDYLQGDLECKF